ncbi:protein crumbs homolog 3 [Rhea pennata]|uniref:protein crumbs homolog 3 n=1 Tax=Rhea pennata TaxID=8795 RepID=UPI002E25531E
MTSNSTSNNTTSESGGGLSAAAEVALIVVFGGLGAFGLVALLVFVAFKVREKRRTEGTYRPSSEEQAGARAAPPAPSELPPEERLI